MTTKKYFFLLNTEYLLKWGKHVNSMTAETEEIESCDEIRLLGRGQFMKIFLCSKTEVLHEGS